MFDYHVHTRFSDGRDSHEEMIEAAIARGYKQLGFSDHFCLLPCDWAIHSLDKLLKTREAFETAKAKYGNQIDLLFGLEIDYFPNKEEQIMKLIEEAVPDYTIGSVHFLGNEGFDSDPNHKMYTQFTPDQLFCKYFSIMEDLINFGTFSIIGHFDLIKKYNLKPTYDIGTTIEELSTMIVEKDLLLELNTSGPDRPCNEFFPSPSIVRMMADMGVKFTIGSDSHKTEHIARNFEEGLQLFETCGISELYTVGKEGKRKPYNLEKLRASFITS